MKTIFFILLIVVLEITAMMWLAQGGAPQSPDLDPAHAPAPLSFVKQSQDLILPPPPTTNIVLHFTYPLALLTNGYLAATTDFKIWYQAAYALVTNGDSVEWWVTNDFSKPCEFFRAGGETIPTK